MSDLNDISVSLFEKEQQLKREKFEQRRKENQKKKLKFNFMRGSATPEGKLKPIRLLSKEHTSFGIHFTPAGEHRTDEEKKAIYEFERRIVEKYLKHPALLRQKQDEFYTRLKKIDKFNVIEVEDIISQIII